MRLHSIRLIDYRAISDATVDFSSGVTIVEGPNEVGKSSIHQAITQLREDKDSSRKASVKDTQPVGSDVGPQVELHLSTGDYELRYSKRWIKQPFTELSVLKPVPEQLSGSEAHERFLAILDETVDVDLLDALDVAQGRSLDQASLAEIKALHGALGEAGEEPADHDAFLDRVETEYLRFFTAKGKETGELRRLTEELPGAEEQHRELKARSADMDGLVDRHARAAERLTNGRTQLASAVTEREEAEQAVQSVSGLKAELDRALERAGVAQRERQLAEEARDRRQALITEVTTAEESVKTADDALKTVTTAQQEEDSSLAEAQKGLEAKQAALLTAQVEAKTAAADLARARARREVDTLRKRLADIRDQERRAAEAKATIGSITVTAKDVEKLGGLFTELRIAQNAKTAAAAQVIARRLGDTAVSIDGVDVPKDSAEEFAVTTDLQIHIDSVVDITVRPGQSPAELDRELESAQTRLDAELDRLDVTTLEQARERSEVRTDAEAVLAEATSTLRVLIGDDDRDGLDAALTRAEHVAGDAADSSKSAASIDELEARVESTTAAVDDASAKVETARTTLERIRADRDEARVAAVRAQSTREQAATTLQNLSTRLSTDREANSDESLDETLTAAAATLTQLEDEAAAARSEYDAADPETLEMRLQNARQLVESKQKQQEKDRQEVDQLSALIDDRAAEGIYDKLKAAEQNLESIRSKLARMQRQANAIKLLRDTVLTHKEEAQRRYVAPFKEAIEKLGRVIFGQGLSVEISENLEIVSRTLNGRTVAFDALSGGTKEQLALIGRLAVATLVDADAGAPVILDDAFGFSDEQRLAALNVILGNVGRKAQVILLTCQPDRFSSIGGAETVSLS
jgi:DNA repair exonuclease SbcCD ATPase subunit